MQQCPEGVTQEAWARMVEDDRLNSLSPPPGCEELGSRALRQLTEACSKDEGYVAVDTGTWGRGSHSFTLQLNLSLV